MLHVNLPPVNVASPSVITVDSTTLDVNLPPFKTAVPSDNSDAEIFELEEPVKLPSIFPIILEAVNVPFDNDAVPSVRTVDTTDEPIKLPDTSPSKHPLNSLVATILSPIIVSP